MQILSCSIKSSIDWLCLHYKKKKPNETQLEQDSFCGYCLAPLREKCFWTGSVFIWSSPDLDHDTKCQTRSTNP